MVVEKINQSIKNSFPKIRAKEDLDKYSPVDSLEKLLMIAKKEYFVAECIELPFSSINFSSTVGKSSFNGEFYILYFGYENLDKMFSLSHEIGHIASGHFNVSAYSIGQEEDEADLYASIILNKSAKELNKSLAHNTSKYYHFFSDELKAHFGKKNREFKKMLDSKGLAHFYKK